jgi:hypothetical protein
MIFRPRLALAECELLGGLWPIVLGDLGQVRVLGITDTQQEQNVGEEELNIFIKSFA